MLDLSRAAMVAAAAACALVALAAWWPPTFAVGFLALLVALLIVERLRPGWRLGRLALLSIPVSLGLAACALPQSPQQAVFAAKSSYVAAGGVALAYISLPRCVEPPGTAVQPCSSPAVVDAVKKADNVAFAALDSAETVVRTPGFGEGAINDAVTAARGAVTAFVSIAGALRR